MSNKQMHICIWAFLLSFTYNQAFNQEVNKNSLVDGKVWTSNGDTVSGKMLYINQYNHQFNITFTDTNGQVIAYYSPKDFGGFSYSIGEDLIEFFSMPNPFDLGRVFLRKIYDGKYTLFQYLEIDSSKSFLSFNVSYYIWEEKWITPPITSDYAYESLLHHFADCPELEYKIKTHQYGLNQIKVIVLEYENCDLTDDYEYFYE